MGETRDRMPLTSAADVVYQQPRLAVVHGDALNLPLPDNSVDLVVTSPPYWALRSYRDGGQVYDGQVGGEPTPTEFVDALLAATEEMVRVTKPSGSIWVNLGDKYNAYNANRGEGTIQRNHPRQEVPSGYGLDVKTVANKSLVGLPWRYAIRCIDELGLVLRAEVVWAKSGLPESVKDRVRRSHETWFHFALRPKYYADRDAIRRLAEDPATGGKGKLPDSVWQLPTQPLIVPDDVDVKHHAAFPMGWPGRIIPAWCPPDGVVLDPFGGTGTTALMAWTLGRTGVSVDLSRDYCELAQWRVTDPGQRAKAAAAADFFA